MSSRDLKVNNLGLALADVFSSRRGNVADALFAIAAALERLSETARSDHPLMAESLEGLSAIASAIENHGK